MACWCCGPISLAACAQRLQMTEAGGGQGAGSGKGAEQAAVVNALAESVTSQFLTHLAVPPGALTAAVLLQHRQRAGGLPLPLLRVNMGAMRRRVVQRGINILDGRVIAQDLEQGLDSAADAISVVGYRDKRVVSVDARNATAMMTLSYLQNAALHVFAHDALVLLSLVAACGGWGRRPTEGGNGPPVGTDQGGGGAGNKGGGKKVVEAEGVELVFEGDEGAAVRDSSEMGSGRVGALSAPAAVVGEASVRVRQVLRHELVYAPHSAHSLQEDPLAEMEGAIRHLKRERLITSSATEVAVRDEELARRHWEIVASMFLPVFEAYWAVAIQALSIFPPATASAMTGGGGGGGGGGDAEMRPVAGIGGRGGRMRGDAGGAGGGRYQVCVCVCVCVHGIFARVSSAVATCVYIYIHDCETHIYIYVCIYTHTCVCVFMSVSFSLGVQWPIALPN